MYKIFMALLLSLSIITACNSEPQSFFGESNNWKAELNTASDGKVEGFVLSYIGSDMQSVGLFDAGVHAGNFGFNSNGAELNSDGNFVFDLDGNPNDMIVKKNSEIITTIEWDGHTEEITLNN
ncbi:hypothetical protein [Bacillus solitudinis]|uniref:hypothetical protein n=1 Tax=Bacillus solitudinis TaxID=2014074 RepID=UPI000C2491E5|nr:hypothetical protein [Bacillus solitudinis]